MQSCSALEDVSPLASRKNKRMKKIFGISFCVACFSFSSFADRLILSDLEFFKKLGVPILQEHPRLKMGFANIEGVEEERLHKVAHDLGRCGGFEEISQAPSMLSVISIDQELKELEKKINKDQVESLFSGFSLSGPKKDVVQLVNEVSSENLRASVTWMQEMGTRSHRASEPNRPVQELERRLRALLEKSRLSYELELISHSGTRQKSIRLRFIGSKLPNEKIILGAHFDSIAGWSSGQAPGADDNASGSSNLIEVVRVLSQSSVSLKRSLEFFWYAGEEGGLIGSSEIARSYKQRQEQVVAALQLDMTLFPGDGPFILGSVTDFTTPWVRDLLSEVNRTYFQYQMNEFRCGYGCSDHASWYRQGYSTVAPFEARMSSMNRDIHTSRDRIQSSYNFEHSAAFSKLALAFALELDQLDSSLIK